MKQVIIFDASLNLPQGKLAAFLKADDITRQAWLAEGMPKVVLRAATTKKLN